MKLRLWIFSVLLATTHSFGAQVEESDTGDYQIRLLAGHLRAATLDLDNGTSGYYDHFAHALKVEDAGSFEGAVAAAAGFVSDLRNQGKPTVFPAQDVDFERRSFNRAFNTEITGKTMTVNLLESVYQELKTTLRADDTEFSTMYADFETEHCKGWLINKYRRGSGKSDVLIAYVCHRDYRDE